MTAKDKRTTNSLPAVDFDYAPGFLTLEQAQDLFTALSSELDWRQDSIRMFGRWVKIPRLQAWYGGTDSQYRYSGLDLSPAPFTATLLQIKQEIEAHCQTDFNAVLANYYRDGSDSMGWHSDNEKELGDQPVIASLSLGAPRRFTLKHRQDASLKHALDLTPGSLLVMSGRSQDEWLHALPKQKRIAEPRINLTFRRIIKS